MFIKQIKNYLLLFVGISMLALMTSCSEDEDEIPGDVSGSIVGTWTGGTATLNSFTVNGEDFSVYIEALIQELIDAGFPVEDAEAFFDDFEEAFVQGATETFDGTLTFNADGTYESTDSEGTDTGTWELIKNDESILIDKGTDEELEIQIISLSDSRFEGLIEDEEVDDFDDDGVDDTFAISVSITLTR